MFALPTCVVALRQACLDGSLDEFTSTHLVVVRRSLPGRAVIGVAHGDGLVWVIVDPDVTDAPKHLLALIDTWPPVEEQDPRSFLRAHSGPAGGGEPVEVLDQPFAPPLQRAVPAWENAV